MLTEERYDFSMRDPVWGGQEQRRGKAALMFQFVSHSLDQLWNTGGLVKGPPRSEQFRDI